jgi:DNA mismatch endonuclease (patch repair protein)
MSRIRSKDTTAELAVRSFLHSRGFRFRVHKKGLPGKPDIVLAKYRTVVFVHGCFWHHHHRCADFHVPRSNRRYWKKKLAGNVARDKVHQEELARLGWRVFIVWGCEIDIKFLNLLAERIRA